MAKALWTALFLALSLIGAKATELEQVVLGQHAGFVRVVFHLDNATPYEVTTDSNAATIVFPDLEDSSRPLAEVTSRHYPITALNYPETESGLSAQIVTDRPVKVQHFALTPDSHGGHRIVMDVTHEGSQPSNVAEREPAPAKQSAPPMPATAENKSASAQPLDIRSGATDPCAGTARALENNPWEMRSLMAHGECLVRSARFNQAEEVYNRVLTFDPDFHRARLALAEVYGLQGRAQDAKSAYQHVLLSSPPPPADVTKQIQTALGILVPGRPRLTRSDQALSTQD